MEFDDTCIGCEVLLTWVDKAYVCDAGCTYCADCYADLDGVCVNCSGMLRGRERRTRPIGR